MYNKAVLEHREQSNSYQYYGMCKQDVDKHAYALEYIPHCHKTHV